ncbi:MAG: DUF1616 domain-containing protein [Anaerolineae bacterium]
MMRHKGRDLFIALFATIVVLLLTGSSGLPRTAAALLLVYFLPGWSMLAAWLPDSLDKPLTRLLFSVFLSTAMTAIGGLILNTTANGLQASAWTRWLGSVTLLNLSIAFVRLVLYPRTIRAIPLVAPLRVDGFRGVFALGMWVVVGTAALFVTAGALTLARASAQNTPTEGFTQLWALPTDTLHQISVGVQNEEGHPVSYQLAISRYPLSGPFAITLNDGESWETTVNLVPIANTPIEITLYRLDQPGIPYRSVQVWLPR